MFDSSGALVAMNRDGGCASVAADPVTQLCWDSRLSFSVPPGVYQVVLTQGENTPRGPTLGDSFIYDGSGNFTADPEMPASRGFWDLSLHQRTSAFAIDISGVDFASMGITPAVTALVSAASQLPGQFAPNEILTYYDPGLTEGPVTVSVAGRAASVLYSGVGQVNFVVPASVADQANVTLQISRAGSILVSTAVNGAAAAPALFTAAQQGTGPAAILNGDYGLNSASTPAHPGEYILAYGTGFGLELPPGADGNAVLAAGVTATVGGVPAEVTNAGSAPGQTPGLQQINIHLAADVYTGTAVPIQLTVTGVPTQPGTTVAIR